MSGVWLRSAEVFFQASERCRSIHRIVCCANDTHCYLTMFLFLLPVSKVLNLIFIDFIKVKKDSNIVKNDRPVQFVVGITIQAANSYDSHGSSGGTLSLGWVILSKQGTNTRFPPYRCFT